MKVLIAFCGLLAISSAEIATSNKYGDIHNTQHEQSVNTAKQSLQERLRKLELDGHGQGGFNSVSYGNAYGSSGSEKYVAGCPSCGGVDNRFSSSRQSTSSSSRNSGAHDYVGVGIVGHSNSRYSADGDHDDVQSVVSPNYGTASRYSSSSSNAYEAEDMQQRQVPSDLSSVSSSAYRQKVSALDEDDLQRTYQPGSRTYSQTRGEGTLESSRLTGSSAPVYGSSHTSHRSSSQHESEQRRVAPVHVSSSVLDSSATAHESDIRGRVSVGQHVNIVARPGQSAVIAVPVRVIHTAGIPSENQQYYSRVSENSGTESRVLGSPTSTTYRVTYSPTRNYVATDKISSTTEEERSRSLGGVQQPEKLRNYNSFNSPDALSSSSQSRYRADEFDSDTQQRVAPVSVSQPSNGGSSRFQSSGSAASQQGHTQSRVAPAFIDSSSSSRRTEEERNDRRYTPPSPTYVSSSRTSASEKQEESRNHISSGRPSHVVSSGHVSSGHVSGSDQSQSSGLGTGSQTVYYVAQPSSRSQTQYQAGSGSQTQSQFQAGGGSQSQFQRPAATGSSFSTYYPSRTQFGSGASATRFGSGVFSSDDDLQTYMSESERLARIQQQQIASGSRHSAASNSEANQRTLHTASNLDAAAANFVRGSSANLASRNSEFDAANVDGASAGNGGYTRVKSWNKQSKWASGSEYGTDGKPKSYSHLSTAEAEKYNINGQETGFKAATTTLENDGKVSTYSIHTP